MKYKYLLSSLIIFYCSNLSAQSFWQKHNFNFSGSIQSDILIPQEDEEIGTGKVKDKFLTNTFTDLNLVSDHIDAGLRLEYHKKPLPGFEKDYAGWGLPMAYAKVHFDKVEATIGSIYEQFGSGFILRTYEERSLGIDNHLRGAHLLLKPYRGVRFKALSGKQRRYWETNEALISGGDLELGIDEWFNDDKGQSQTHITLGASWVNKYEKQETLMADALHKFKFPEYTNAFDIRLNMQSHGFNLLGEYAWKTQEPNMDNGFIYQDGSVAMLSATYSKPGFSVLLQAKRSDNMPFKSERLVRGSSSFINHLPAFTMDHTYILAANYPYATQPGGEWAYQAQLNYNFRKGSLLGGKYGTDIKVNFSYVNSIDKKQNGDPSVNPLDKYMGYSSDFFKWGKERYYQDLNIQLDKKFSKEFKLSLMYMNQFYNMTVIEGEGGMVHSDIFIAEGKYRFNRKLTLRGEMQFLSTKQDEGDWAYGLLELTILPHWMLTISDQWNCGETDIHYYQALVTYNQNAHRIQIGYGKTNDGFNCSGGVCRYVPASKGLTISYNYNF